MLICVVRDPYPISSSHRSHLIMHLITAIICMLMIMLVRRTSCQMEVGFYRHTCPKAEEIVSSVVMAEVRRNPRNAPFLLRLQFHDCFVDVSKTNSYTVYLNSGSVSLVLPVSLITYSLLNFRAATAPFWWTTAKNRNLGLLGILEYRDLKLLTWLSPRSKLRAKEWSRAQTLLLWLHETPSPW